MWSQWGSDRTDVIWDDHSCKKLWYEWSTSFHTEWKVVSLKSVLIFDTKAIHIYVFLKKQLERYKFYKINTIDNTIETEIQKYLSKVYSWIDLRLKTDDITIKESDIANLDCLKLQIENSRAITKLNLHIQNLKVLDFKKHLDKSYEEIIKCFKVKKEEKRDCYGNVISTKETRETDEIDKIITKHANRDIIKTLEEKEQTIESIKKQSEYDLKQCSEEKEKFYLDKYKYDMSKVVSDAKWKVENVQKELEFTHSYNAKEKQEMRKEIQDLTFKLDDTLAQNRRLARQLEINKKKDDAYNTTKKDSIENSDDYQTIIDCSNEENVTKLIEDEELKIENIKLSNFHNVKSKTIELLSLLVSSKITKDWELVAVEAEGDKMMEISKHLTFLCSLLSKGSKCVSLQGFDIDKNWVSKIFESSYKTEKLSLRNWIMDISNEVKIDENLEFSIYELEFIGIVPKDEKESKDAASNLVTALTKSTLSKSLRQVRLSQSNKFSSFLWESIKSDFKDQVETIITNNPWLFNDIL